MQRGRAAAITSLMRMRRCFADFAGISDLTDELAFARDNGKIRLMVGLLRAVRL